MLHFVNIFISSTSKNECSWYLFITTFDNFFGLLTNYLLLKVVAFIAGKCNAKFILSGNYFKEGQSMLDDVQIEGKSKRPQIDYRVWSA